MASKSKEELYKDNRKKTETDDGYKLMIRAGAHCTNPYHYSLGIKPFEGTARASIYLYNTEEEIKILKESLEKLVDLIA